MVKPAPERGGGEEYSKKGIGGQEVQQGNGAGKQENQPTAAGRELKGRTEGRRCNPECLVQGIEQRVKRKRR